MICSTERSTEITVRLSCMRYLNASCLSHPQCSHFICSPLLSSRDPFQTLTPGNTYFSPLISSAVSKSRAVSLRTKELLISKTNTDTLPAPTALASLTLPCASWIAFLDTSPNIFWHLHLSPSHQ